MKLLGDFESNTDLPAPIQQRAPAKTRPRRLRPAVGGGHFRNPAFYTLHRALHDGRPVFRFPGADGRLPIRSRCGVWAGMRAGLRLISFIQEPRVFHGLSLGPPPRALTNGRPGFPFGFLSAGERLLKARRGRVCCATHHHSMASSSSLKVCIRLPCIRKACGRSFMGRFMLHTMCCMLCAIYAIWPGYRNPAQTARADWLE